MSETVETTETSTETTKGITAKTISKIFKFVAAIGAILCAVLKWINVMPNASVGEICALWGTIYGIGAGTIDANIMIDKFTGTK